MTLRGHLQVLRLDHWIKNLFVLPGIALALALGGTPLHAGLIAPILFGLLAIGLTCSSNYVLNELLDAPYDRSHPDKRNRPVPSGRVSVPLAYAQWLFLLAVALGIAWFVSLHLVAMCALLWVMGLVYNVPPLRAKDRPYIDVLVEALNNPIRLLAGWWMVAPLPLAPLSLLAAYWMGGSYLMTLKRFAELREIGADQAAAYRPVLAGYSEKNLLTATTFYGATAMLFFGAFCARYRFELIFSYPFVATVMAIYLRLAFQPHSAASAPEKLYREPTLMIAVTICAIALGLLTFVDLPGLQSWFGPPAELLH